VLERHSGIVTKWVRRHRHAESQAYATSPAPERTVGSNAMASNGSAEPSHPGAIAVPDAVQTRLRQGVRSVLVDAAALRLHKAAHFARRATGCADTIVLRNDTAELFANSAVEVDAVAFETAARAALAARDTAGARRALDGYGGELLPQDPYEDWAAPRREQLRQLHLELLRLDERWQDLADLDTGDERAHLELMRRYIAAGDRHAALRQFERLDRVLRRELGVAPSS